MKEETEEMKLPEGETCGDCAKRQFCYNIGCTKPENTSCDYWPSRFSALLADAESLSQ